MQIAYRAAMSGLVAVLVVAAGCGGQSSLEQGAAGASSATSELNATTSTLPPPVVEFVVYDGTTLPATVIAGCSEPTCMGAADGTNPTPGTGTVTNSKNNVGWMVSGGDPKGAVYLYVDGRKVASARSTKLLVWSASAGAHTLQTMAYNTEGVAGWSAPVSITAELP
jgi:hypothetical protein